MEGKRDREGEQEKVDKGSLVEREVHCYKCNVLIGRFMRKKKRKKMCKSCSSERRSQKNKNEPIRLVEARFRSALHNKKIKVPANVDIGDMVKRICERWENKSVLSGKGDLSTLCITGYRRFKECQMPSENDLVLVTASESISLSRYQSDEYRMGKFPPMVRAKIIGGDEK